MVIVPVVLHVASGTFPPTVSMVFCYPFIKRPAGLSNVRGLLPQQFSHLAGALVDNISLTTIAPFVLSVL